MAVIGIDFGTSRSCVAILQDQTPSIVLNEYGNTSTASYVSWDSASKVVVGDTAKDTASTNPKHTISSLKTILGRRHRDPFLRSFATSVQYQIVDQAGIPHVRLDYQKDGKDHFTVSIEEAATRLFAEFKRTAELHLRTPVKAAVVATPAYYRTPQREALKKAAQAAGLQVLRMVHEPSAVLTAYALRKGALPEAVNVAVVDFGAGSLQVTIACIEDGVVDTKSVLGTPELGGDIIDLRLLDHLIHKFHRSYGIDLRRDPPALRRLRTACERAKRQLSTAQSTEINIESLTRGINFDYVVTRRTLESICPDIFVSIREILSQALKNARLSSAVDDIKEVLLVGGSSKIPRVQEEVKKFFGKAPEELGEDSSELVAFGASLLSVPPDESPLGAAGVLTLEVLDSTIGVEGAGGEFIAIASRNSTLPLKKTRTFVAANDDQTRLIVRVFEGESATVDRNTQLAAFEVGNIPPGSSNGSSPSMSSPNAVRDPETSPSRSEIDVTVEVDENHHVKVYAKHAPSNRNIGFELDSSVVNYDWSTQLVGGSPGAIKLVQVAPTWSQAGWRSSTIPVSRSTAPTPVSKSRSGSVSVTIPPPDTGRADLEKLANKIRDASVQLGDASNKALEFVKQAPPNGLQNGRSRTSSTFGGAVPSPYFSRLMELRELCSSLLLEIGDPSSAGTSATGGGESLKGARGAVP